MAPGELIYSAGRVTERFEQQLQALRQGGAFTCPMSPRPDWQFDSALGERKLLEQLGAASLQAWSAQDLAQAHAAAAALLAYAEHTQGRRSRMCTACRCSAATT
jgi:DNA mismatch repair protein MutS